MPPTIIFDFDGTIANTLEAAVEIYNVFASNHRCRIINPTDLERLRQSSPRELMAEFGVSTWKLPLLVQAVRKGLKDRSLAPQDGIVEAIRYLRAQGATLGILTSNSKENVQAFLQANGLSNFFSFISSSRRIFGKHKTLIKIIKAERLNPSQVVYVGDERRDIEAAKKAGVKSVGVTWGFQTLNALKSATPDVIANTPAELLALTK